MNLKCIVCLTEGREKCIEATLIGTAQRSDRLQYQPCKGSPPYIIYTVDALVLLNVFEKGAIYQLPMNQVKVVDEWPKHEEA